MYLISLHAIWFTRIWLLVMMTRIVLKMKSSSQFFTWIQFVWGWNSQNHLSNTKLIPNNLKLFQRIHQFYGKKKNWFQIEFHIVICKQSSLWNIVAFLALCYFHPSTKSFCQRLNFFPAFSWLPSVAFSILLHKEAFNMREAASFK